MSEPISFSGVSAAAVLGIAVVMPDTSAAVGALAGATLWILQQRELGILPRVLYFLISFVVGYANGAEVSHLIGFESAMPGAVIVSALLVIIANTVMAGLKKLDFLDVINAILKKFGLSGVSKNDDR
jgi:hypothetical protein